MYSLLLSSTCFAIILEERVIQRYFFSFLIFLHCLLVLFTQFFFAVIPISLDNISIPIQYFICTSCLGVVKSYKNSEQFTLFLFVY